MKPTIKTLTQQVYDLADQANKTQAALALEQQKNRELSSKADVLSADCGDLRRRLGSREADIQRAVLAMQEARSRAISNRGAAADKIALDLILSLGAVEQSLR